MRENAGEGRKLTGGWTEVTGGCADPDRPGRADYRTRTARDGRTTGRTRTARDGRTTGPGPPGTGGPPEYETHCGIISLETKCLQGESMAGLATRTAYRAS
jgi:hypothetical protein